MTWIDESRWDQGMSTERYHPWFGHDLRTEPVPGVEGVRGGLSLIVVGEHNGMRYEQTEPVGDQHYRHTSSAPIPDVVRSA